MVGEDDPGYSTYMHQLQVQEECADYRRADYGPDSDPGEAAGSTVLPTPRTEAADALERLSLRPGQPQPDEGA